MHTKYVPDFFIKIMKYYCLLGDKYKFTRNERDKDHKSPKYIILLHSSNFTFNIRVLQHLKVRSNLEHSFMH